MQNEIYWYVLYRVWQTKEQFGVSFSIVSDNETIIVFRPVQNTSFQWNLILLKAYWVYFFFINVADTVISSRRLT